MNDTKIKLIRKMPDGDSIFILWVGLLCLAMKSGKPGIVEIGDGIPFTAETLSTEFDIKLNTVKLGLKIFQEFKMIELWPNGEQYIVNFEKHQELSKIIRSKELSRKSSQKFRDKQKLLSDSHVTKSDKTDKEEDKEEDKEKDFKNICVFGDNIKLNELKEHPNLKNVDHKYLNLCYMFFKKQNKKSPLKLKVNDFTKTTTTISKILKSSTLEISEIKSFCFKNLDQDLKENIHQVEFNKFWKLYVKTTDKQKCLAKWKKLPKKDKIKIFETLPEYTKLQKTKEDQFKRSSPVYLNNETWNDAIDKPESKYKKSPNSSHDLRLKDNRPEHEKAQWREMPEDDE